MFERFNERQDRKGKRTCGATRGCGARFLYDEKGGMRIPEPKTLPGEASPSLQNEGQEEASPAEPEGKEIEAGESRIRGSIYGIIVWVAFLAGLGFAYYLNPDFKNSVNEQLAKVDEKLSDAYEYVFDRETYKLKRMDSDGGGVSDWEEIQRGTNPYLTPREEEEERQKKLREMLRKEFYDALAEKIGKEDAKMATTTFDLSFIYRREDNKTYVEHLMPLVLDKTAYITNISEARNEIKDF
ncbi:MAG: hypothetical protein GXO66_09425, partial [Euryarchaeota archaeon]|nr:hypothetical protein [Euryarchaeota archaeon]